MDQIFNLKFTSKQLVRASRKCEKEEKDEKLKIKKAIEKGGCPAGAAGGQFGLPKVPAALALSGWWRTISRGRMFCTGPPVKLA